MRQTPVQNGQRTSVQAVHRAPSKCNFDSHQVRRVGRDLSASYEREDPIGDARSPHRGALSPRLGPGCGLSRAPSKCGVLVNGTVNSRAYRVQQRRHKSCGFRVGPATPQTSLFVSTLPLRVRFGLVVAAITAGVGAVWWLSLRMWERQGEATFWFALSGILLVTLLVDQAARLLIYRRLAHMRETMQRAAAGQLNARVSIDGLDELGVIARGLNDILQGLERLNEALDVRVETATEAFRQKSVEIADSHREMAILSEELARAGRLAALGQAAANMAHQIGTPLNLISGYVQLLIQSSPAESASVDRLRAIQDQVAKVTAIVRAALDSSRPPAIPHERADLGALVRRVCQMASPMFEDAGVQVEVTAPDQSMELLADPVQLELALLNLISNSVDAMASGGKLTLQLVGVDDRLRLEVADTGSGIPPELLAHIFDPWVTTKAHGKGSGLGLSIARQVIVRHGGTIRVENRPGRGAVFTIDLPAVHGMRRHPDSAHAENSRR
jgi:signal transduction histidine kinase